MKQCQVQTGRSGLDRDRREGAPVPSGLIGVGEVQNMQVFGCEACGADPSLQSQFESLTGPAGRNSGRASVLLSVQDRASGASGCCFVVWDVPREFYTRGGRAYLHHHHAAHSSSGVRRTRSWELSKRFDFCPLPGPELHDVYVVGGTSEPDACTHEQRVSGPAHTLSLRLARRRLPEMWSSPAAVAAG